MDLPQNLQDLLIVVTMGVLGLLTWVVRAVIRLFAVLNTTLTNHFAHDQEVLQELSRQMAAQTELLRVLLDETRAEGRAHDDDTSR
ncbi:MAG: hypothetical protein QN162_15325 [Armatimonadota bacterium]|nr:hypothetical protein [Armatimonadota bacterium]